MKNTLLFLLLFLLVVPHTNAADNPAKIGFVNLEFIMNSLPDSKKIESDLISFQNELQKQLQEKLKLLQDKLQDFDQNHTTMSDDLKNQKQAEFQQLHADFKKLQTESQKSLANKQVELIRPIYQKILKAIQEVAKENKFTHILNADTGGISIILYAQPEYNISNLVLKKLGIDPIQAAKAPLEQPAKKAQVSKTPDPSKKGETSKPQNKNKN